METGADFLDGMRLVNVKGGHLTFDKALGLPCAIVCFHISTLSDIVEIFYNIPP